MQIRHTGGCMISRTLPLVLAVFLTGAALLDAEVISPEDQIAEAILAAPEGSRDDATVLGWKDGKVVTLREGSNELVCLAHTPGAPRYSVACYHKDLDPFMARGRELSADGITGQVRAETRLKEVDEGKLEMPRAPRTLYVLHGSGFDTETKEVEEPYLRWVIYVPYATPESTGLGTKGGESLPWLMGEGTAGAHIMINPPRP
jgi:hypothetical protein